MIKTDVNHLDLVYFCLFIIDTVVLWCLFSIFGENTKILFTIVNTHTGLLLVNQHTRKSVKNYFLGTMKTLLLSILLQPLAGGAAATGNMNVKSVYVIANPTPKTPAQMPFYGNFFEILGPETTTKYSQVYWKSQPINLPPDIVTKFDGKVMAVTGMEVDIVRTNQEDGVTTISAPAYEIYNHHYSGWMNGKLASKQSQSGSDDNPISGGSKPSMAHGQPLPQWRVTKTGNDDNFYPNVQAFSEGNGNEHRGAYKGYPKNFAQLIFSPQTWSNNPMIINTNKRLTGDTSPGHISRLVPSHSLAPDDSNYSGILECPCTDRKVKMLDGYKKKSNATCDVDTKITTMEECLAAVEKMGMTPIVLNSTTATSTLNDRASSCTVSHDDKLEGWNVQYGDRSCVPNDNKKRESQLAAGSAGSASTTFADNTSIEVSVSMTPQNNMVQIVLSGPATTWYASAFNATQMSDSPYAIIVSVDKVTNQWQVEERILANHAPGTTCKPTTAGFKVISNQVSGDRRTVTVERPAYSDCFTFSSNLMKETTMPILLARGSTTTFGYHGTTRASTLLTFAREGSSLCVCRDLHSNAGTIDGIVFNSKVCAPFPTSELLTTKNAICNISRYEGGLYCCHHDSILLDSHQIVPNKTDTWRLKYRFYYEEFSTNSTTDSHQNLFRTWWSTEATNNEYDVPKSTANCLDPMTPSKNCVHVLKSQFTGRDIILGKHGGGGTQCMVSGDSAACGNITLIEERDGGKFQLMYAAAHCHTPACVSLELWNDDTGELICRNAPVYGTGDVAQNESGYVISIPPCLFGSEEEGLLPPHVLSLDTNLTTIKVANNTNGHWGVMALWQMRAAYVGGNPPSWR